MLGNLTNNAAFIYSGTNAQTLSGIISGTGALTQNAASTLTLSGDNTYSGATTINAGTLVLGNANAAGSGTITQTDATSLLKFDTTGTITNAVSVYNVLATQSATLSGAITVNNATWDIDTGDTLTVSGDISGSGGVTKNGGGILLLSGSNSYNGSTTVNNGTLEITSLGALGTTTAVNLDGGSLLVRAGDAINDSAAMNLGGGALSLNGTFDESVGALTLSANSVIDVKNFSGNLTFSALGNWLAGTSLAITNWTGFNKYGTQIGDLSYNPYIVFTDTTNLAGYLDRISFYSGDFGQGFAGTAFDVGFGQIKPVPEPETWATGILLVLSSGVWLWRKRTQAA